MFLTRQADAIVQFKNIRLTIFNLWEDLEKVPDTNFERDLARDDSEASFVLSRNNLNAIKELQTKVLSVKKKKELREIRVYSIEIGLQSLTKRVDTTLQSCVQLVYCREIIISQTVWPSFPPFQCCSHYDNREV